MTQGGLASINPAMPRVLSGIQANGRLHIGNLIGALRQWTKMLDEISGYFCIADLHALSIPTQVRNTNLEAATEEVAAWYVAAGIDPGRATVFAQSSVPQHCELAWVLMCFTPMGWLERMTQFKSKGREQGERASAGLFTYPVLQAADILLYQANYVPVGEDQRQHIELTRDVAQRFNSLAGEVFVLPEGMTPKVGARIMGLDDPTQKMSKSIAELRPAHAVFLADHPSVIARKIMSAQTDSSSAFDPANTSPGVKNLVEIATSLSDGRQGDLVETWAGIGYGELKKRVAEIVIETLRPIQDRYEELTADRAVMRSILDAGRQRAEEVAEQTMTAVTAALHLRR